jgi:hypothetical protein
MATMREMIRSRPDTLLIAMAMRGHTTAHQVGPKFLDQWLDLL